MANEEVDSDAGGAVEDEDEEDEETELETD